MEKQPELLPVPVAPAPERKRSRRGFISLLGLLALGGWAYSASRASDYSTQRITHWASKPSHSCAQVPPLMPEYDLSRVWDNKERIVKWHQDSVRIPTEVWDEMGAPGEDTRWEVFEQFHTYLEQAFPKVHETLKRTKVDTWGLIYEWEGKDSSLKPLFITGHQDVVPVLKETEYQWEHPPFSGHYDGEAIWGRGASDDKSTVTAIMGAIELLLEDGEFSPTRTVVLGFGHDEERGGMRGAPAIRDWLLEKYGKDSMAMLVDEGSGMSTMWGRTFGLPAVAEKGKYDLNMTISTRGGHSSVPPEHTGIGLAALLVAQLERHPHAPRLTQKSPLWGFLQCAANHAPEIPKDLRKGVERAGKGCKKALGHLPKQLVDTGLGDARTGPGQGNMVQAMMSTTQATDMVRGGVKVNALPEFVEVIVNHRLDVASSIKELKDAIFDTVLPAAKELHLGLEGYGRSYSPKEARGTVYLGGCSFSEDLEPAPISPTSADAPAWQMLAGTSRALWASRKAVSPSGALVSLAPADELAMAPFMSTGNTDTRRYWDLTKNIYRWRYISDDDSQGAHTVNEAVGADALVDFVRWFQALVLNADASREL